MGVNKIRLSRDTFCLAIHSGFTDIVYNRAPSRSDMSQAEEQREEHSAIFG
jgi:hypothetical protein